MVTTRSPFCGYKTIRCVQLNGEDLSCYPNKIESVSLRKCQYDHRLTNKAYLSAITVTNIYQSFTYKMAQKLTGVDVEQNYVTITLCIRSPKNSIVVNRERKCAENYNK